MTTKTIASLWWDILDFIYPPRCPVCQVPLGSGRELMCPGCISGFREDRGLMGPYCPWCKRPLASFSAHCGCQDIAEPLPAVFSLGVYDQGMEALLHSFKYKRRKNLGLFLSGLLGERLVELERFPEVDSVVPVPLHKSKLKERGFNQSEAIAKELCQELGVPINSGVVTRKKKTRTQTGLSREERQENVKGAFTVPGGVDLQGRRLLLVDDVLTTGATMLECARTLKEAGAERIWGVTLAVVAGTESLEL